MRCDADGNSGNQKRSVGVSQLVTAGAYAENGNASWHSDVKTQGDIRFKSKIMCRDRGARTTTTGTDRQVHETEGRLSVFCVCARQERGAECWKSGWKDGFRGVHAIKISYPSIHPPNRGKPAPSNVGDGVIGLMLRCWAQASRSLSFFFFSWPVRLPTVCFARTVSG